jgi:hypothetical protein
MFRTALSRFVLLGVLGQLVFAACAPTGVPATSPVTSMADLAGRWEGRITQGFNGPVFQYFLTIRPDGTLEATWGPNWQFGKITVADGVATFEMNDASSGPVKYYDTPAGKSMTMEPSFGGWYVQATPVR